MKRFVSILVALIMVLSLSACSSGGSSSSSTPESAAVAFIKCLHKTYDFQDTADMAPSDYLDFYLELHSISINELRTRLKKLGQIRQQDENLAISGIEASGVKNADPDRVKTYNNMLEGFTLNYEDIKEVSVTNAGTDTSAGWVDTVYVVKVNGKWYVHPAFLRNNCFDAAVDLDDD